MRIIVSLVLAGLTVFGGCWAYAKYNLTDRIAELSLQSKGLCNQRGGGTIDKDRMLNQFRAMADSVDLEVSEATVSLEPLDRSGGGPRVGNMVQNTLSDLTAGKIKMNARVLKVDAWIRGKKWLWSTSKRIGPSCIFIDRMERTEDKQVRDTANNIRTRTRNILDSRR